VDLQNTVALHSPTAPAHTTLRNTRAYAFVLQRHNDAARVQQRARAARCASCADRARDRPRPGRTPRGPPANGCESQSRLHLFKRKEASARRAPGARGSEGERPAGERLRSSSHGRSAEHIAGRRGPEGERPAGERLRSSSHGRSVECKHLQQQVTPAAGLAIASHCAQNVLTKGTMHARMQTNDRHQAYSCRSDPRRPGPARSA